MPPDGYTALTLPEDAVERLEELRDGEQWGEFVHDLADAYEGDTADGETVTVADLDRDDGHESRRAATPTDLDGLREDLESRIPTLTARELRESTLR